MSHRHFIALQTLALDEIKRFLRIWPQTLLSSSINMMLFFIIFSTFSQVKVANQIPYIQFIAPGLIMMSIIINAYGNVAFSLWSHRACGSIDELITSPLPNHLIIIGYCIGGTLRGILVGCLVACIALFFTDLPLQSTFLTLTISLFTAILFSLAGFINAICAQKFDDVLFVPTFILTPLTLLGGIFYSVTQLPLIWQKISLINPIVYIIDAFRFGLLGFTNSNVYISLAVVMLSILLLFAINLTLLNKGVGITK